MAAAEAPQRGETSSVVRVDSTAPFSHTVKLQLTEQTIHDASRGDRLLSPEFSGGGFRWAIMTLVGGDTSAPGHISVYLTLVSPNASIRAAFQMQIGNVTLKEEALVSFDTTPNFRLFDRGWAKALPHADAISWLADNDGELPITVTVRPQIRPVVVEPLCPPVDTIADVSVPPRTLGTDLLSLLASGRGTDVTLVCRNERIRAHSLLLSLRSPVFHALLAEDSPLRAPDLGAVPVPEEIQPTTLRSLVEFLYSDDPPELSTSEEARPAAAPAAALQHIVRLEAQHLFNAADHYALPRLRAICERALCGLLSIENAALSATLAEQHHASGLREHALAFIAKHAADVMDSQGWAHLCAARPTLVQDVMRTMARGSPPKPAWARGEEGGAVAPADDDEEAEGEAEGEAAGGGSGSSKQSAKRRRAG